MRLKTNVQRIVDGIIDKIFLRFIPHSVTPNQVTVLRFILIPIMCYLFAISMFDWALVVFVIAASTDFIDGAMARTRNQITDLGKIIDPVADKLLILTALVFIGFDYLIVKIFVGFIALELVAIFLDAIFALKIGKVIGANVYGKIKMILQSFSVGLFILGVAVNSQILINISEETLILALVFAILSAIEQVKTRAGNNKKI
ncbi:MAG: CDP-alcohol phosphatidyltransferase family protein [Candidatus Saccharimonadales bacterium]